MGPEAASGAAPAPDATGVANAAEAAILLAAQAGLDVTSAPTITLAFADSGDVTVSAPGADPVTVSAADIAAASDEGDDRAPAPPPAAD